MHGIKVVNDDVCMLKPVILYKLDHPVITGSQKCSFLLPFVWTVTAESVR
jgi:hypothetical protein